MKRAPLAQRSFEAKDKEQIVGNCQERVEGSSYRNKTMRSLKGRNSFLAGTLFMYAGSSWDET